MPSVQAEKVEDHAFPGPLVCASHAELEVVILLRLQVLPFCELDYKLHPTKSSASLYKAVYTQEVASIEADRSYSENYISPLIVNSWYISLRVKILQDLKYIWIQVHLFQVLKFPEADDEKAVLAIFELQVNQALNSIVSQAR